MRIPDRPHRGKKACVSEDLTEVSSSYFLDLVESAINVKTKHFKADELFLENCTTSSNGGGICHVLAANYTSNVTRCCFKRDLALNWGSAFYIADMYSRTFSADTMMDLITVVDNSDRDGKKGSYATMTMCGYEEIREMNISDCYTMKERQGSNAFGCSLRFAPGNAEKDSICKFAIIRNAVADYAVISPGIGSGYTYSCTLSDLLVVNNTAQYSVMNYHGTTIIANSTFAKSPISFYSEGTNPMMIVWCAFDEEPSSCVSASVSEYFSANWNLLAIAEEHIKWTEACLAPESYWIGLQFSMALVIGSFISK